MFPSFTENIFQNDTGAEATKGSAVVEDKANGERKVMPQCITFEGVQTWTWEREREAHLKASLRSQSVRILCYETSEDTRGRGIGEGLKKRKPEI